MFFSGAVVVANDNKTTHTHVPTYVRMYVRSVAWAFECNCNTCCRY